MTIASNRGVHDTLAAKLADLSGIWLALRDGRAFVVDAIHSNEHHTFVLAPRDSDALPRTYLNILERYLAGDAQKLIAAELAVAQSTIALRIREGLVWMGLRTGPLHPPALLVLAYQAWRSGLTIPVTVSSDPLGVRVRIRRCDHHVDDGLSPAERAVVMLLVDGHTHASIARARNCSARTIANQIASATRKLGVSGRQELVTKLSLRALEGRAARTAPFMRQEQSLDFRAFRNSLRSLQDELEQLKTKSNDTRLADVKLQLATVERTLSSLEADTTRGHDLQLAGAAS